MHQNNFPLTCIAQLQKFLPKIQQKKSRKRHDHMFLCEILRRDRVNKRYHLHHFSVKSRNRKN